MQSVFLISLELSEETTSLLTLDSMFEEVEGWDSTGHMRIIMEIEERLDKLKGNDLTILNQLSQTFLNGFKQLTDTPAEIVETPLESVTAAISARDEKKIKKFFFCPLLLDVCFF